MATFLSLLLLTTIVFMVKFNHNFVSSDCIQVAGIVQEHKIMQQTYRRVQRSSLYECAALCMMSSTCQSIDFDTTSRICNLNRQNSDTSPLQNRAGFIHSDIQHWPKKLTGACSDVTCPSGQTCSVDRNGGVSCIYEFQGCGTPPQPEGTLVNYEGDFLNSEAKYSCKEGYMQCSAQNVRNCQSSGVWDDVTGLCGQSKWVNTGTNASFFLPCGPSKQFSIFIRGTPTENTQVTFALFKYGSQDRLFHTVIIFQHRGHSRIVLTNIRVSGVWGTEEMTSTFPFNVGTEFSVEISLNNGLYKFAADGADITSRHEPVTGAQAGLMYISGDVLLTYVNITRDD